MDFINLQVYFGLLIFLGYMVYDTQEIIERAHRGDMDYIKHALTLFTDFVAVLVRILVIMVSLWGLPDYLDRYLSELLQSMITDNSADDGLLQFGRAAQERS